MSGKKTMERRRFLSVCSLAGAALAGVSVVGDAQSQSTPPPPQQPTPARRRYRIDVEIVECKAGRCAQHKLGDKFAYPADRGRMCPWLLDSMNGAVRVLEYGGTMPWMYKGTPYEKVIDPDGITTEFIRCPDPTDSGVVVKITRTKV
jgi:uncharacterized repeat protein (TIGR04076 family)